MSSTAATRPSHPSPRPSTRAVPAGTAALPLGRLGGVEVIQWPADAARREELALTGEPCVLVLGIDDPVPRTIPSEDWVREPVDVEELAARCAALRRRSRCGAVPTLDDGLLVHGGAWAAVPPAQVTMVELLLQRLGRVVSKDELAQAAKASGGSDHEDAVKAAMNRLARRLSPLGLELRSIRGRGYLLQVAGACCPVHGVPSAAETKDSST